MNIIHIKHVLLCFSSCFSKQRQNVIRVLSIMRCSEGERSFPKPLEYVSFGIQDFSDFIKSLWSVIVCQTLPPEGCGSVSKRIHFLDIYFVDKIVHIKHIIFLQLNV